MGDKNVTPLFHILPDRFSHPDTLIRPKQGCDPPVLSVGPAELDQAVLFEPSKISLDGAFRAVEFGGQFVVPGVTAPGAPAGDMIQLSLLPVVEKSVVEVGDPDSCFVRVRPGYFWVSHVGILSKKIFYFGLDPTRRFADDDVHRVC